MQGAISHWNYDTRINISLFVGLIFILIDLMSPIGY